MAKDILPDHMTSQRDAYQRHFAITVFLSIFMGVGFALYAPFTEWIVGYAASGPYRAGAALTMLTFALSVLYLAVGFDFRFIRMKLRNFKGLSALFKAILSGGLKSPVATAIAAGLAILCLALLAVPAILANVKYEFAAWWNYTGVLFTDPGSAHSAYVAESTPNVAKGDALSAMFSAVAFIAPAMRYILWTIAGFMVGASFQLANPYKNLVMKDGYVEWCTDDWLENNMERRWDKNFGWMTGQVGITGGRLMALGRWTGKRRKGQMIKMIETLSMLCFAPPGTGKSLAPHEKLIRYDGTIARADEIHVGDLVMGPDSKPRLVTDITPGFGPMYRVTPEIGDPWECNGPHILSLRSSATGELRNVSIETYLEWSPQEKDEWRQWRPARVEFPDPVAPQIDAYLIGLAIAGELNIAPELARADRAHFASFLQYKGSLLNIRLDLVGRPTLPLMPSYCSFGLNDEADHDLDDAVSDAIKTYGLGVAPEDKFIPHPLKTAAAADRLALLAGMIDSGGHYDKTSLSYNITASSPRLADDIAFVARSLGFAIAIDQTEQRPPTNEKTGPFPPCWQITILGGVSVIPCKRPGNIAKESDHPYKFHDSPFKIERISDGPYIGMMLDQDHLYLLKDFAVTHNTAGLIVPTIVQDDDITFICNDTKPELYDMTGAHRETVSAVFMLNWAKVDIINSKNPDKSVFYPRFNFLSPDLVPPPGPNRDTYIDSISRVLVPDQKGGGDTYFTDKGRAALTGFLHFLITHAGDYQRKYLSAKGKPLLGKRREINLPDEWLKDQEPSIPMLSDWMAYAQLKSSGGMPEPVKAIEDLGDDEAEAELRKAEEIDRILEGGGKPPPQDPNAADPLKGWLLELVKLEHNTNGSSRAMVELSNLVNMADKERSGVLGTMDKALLPFKNAAVKQRAGACDFTPDDMRGVFRDEIRARIANENISTTIWTGDSEIGEAMIAAGKVTSIHSTLSGSTTVVWDDQRYRDICKNKASWMPVTLYMSVNQADAPAFASITSLLYEVLITNLISLDPGGYNEKSQRVTGPFAVCFALDEFAKLPKTPKLLEGPDLARSKQVSLMIVCQSPGQILNIYSKEEAQTINATTAIKLIYPQNDTDSVKAVQDLVSTTTVKTHSKTTQEGLSKSANPLAWSEADKVDATKFLRTEDISSIPTGQHLLLVQGHLNHPMLLETPLFFKDPELKKKVRSRGEGPIPTKIVPDYVFIKRQQELDKKFVMKIKAAAEEKIIDFKAIPPRKTLLELLKYGAGLQDAA